MESSFKAETLRARLAKVLPSLLRLVSLVLLSLPNSRQVREAGAAFVETHHKALLRILREAASPAIRFAFWSCQIICQSLCVHMSVQPVILTRKTNWL